ncbi:restriction endonuclease subunit S [uncultured Nostoc sp.]|uniref:restriction endonuclease subunit S n=1 Tax=uncultured Nostoc sp. TaxID=340711 RepID=UPI0035CA64CB
MSRSKSTLDELAFFQRGFDITMKQLEDGNYPVISSSGVQGYHSVAKVKGPGVIIGRKGTLGSVHYIESDFWPHDTTLWVKDFKGNNPKFVYYFLKTLELERFDSGGANPTLNRNHIHGLEIIKPLPVTQERIAEILSNYDRLIDNNNRRIALLEESIHQLYKEWFVRSRFPGYESVKVVDGIPEGWSKVTISDLYSTSSGGTPSRKKNDEYYMGGNIPWLKTQELNNRWIIDTEEKITESGLSNSSAKLFPKGTFIIAMYGATIGQFGILSKECTTNQACCALLYQSEYLFNYAYAFGYLLTEREKIISMGQGSAQPNISQQVIKKLDILKPSEVIIKYYNSIVEPWLDAMLSYQLMNIKLKEARDLLLPRLMNGSIAV